MSDPKNCPRCGAEEIGYGYSGPPMTGEVSCYSGGCEVITIADTENEAIDIWNKGIWHYRPVEWDDMGNPCKFEKNEASHDPH